MHIVENNTLPTQSSSKKGCLKVFLIVFGISIVLFSGGCLYILDLLSGNAAKRFENKENERLAKETLPEKYKSYPDLSELQNTDEYEVIPLGTAPTNSFYILPDNTLVLADKSGGDFFRINREGNIIGYYKNPELEFYGTSLMNYTVFTPPFIVSDDKGGTDKEEVKEILEKTIPDAVISGVYSNWPVNGDTTLFPMQSINKIAANRMEKIAAYDKADAVMSKWLSGNKVEWYYFLHINDVWYISDYDYDKSIKQIYTPRENYFRNLNDFGNITVDYKKRNYYAAEKSTRFWTGGVDHWSGDIYLKMKVGKASVLFKTTFKEDKDDGDIRVNFDVLNMGNYVIINNYMIRQRIKANS